MLQMHNLLKIQCHHDGNINLQIVGRRKQLRRKARTGQSSMCIRNLIEPCFGLFLVFQEAGPLAVDWTNASDVSAVLKA